VVLALLGMGYLLVGDAPGAAKRPAIETFAAVAGASGAGTLRFEIEEFLTDQDIQELAQVYAKGGEDAVDSGLGKIEKGR
jgi:hypothetical protein